MAQICIFRCRDLTANEIDFLDAYSKAGFPAFEVMAREEYVSLNAIKQRFSRIYRKLEIENINQLCRLLTACHAFRQ